MIKLDGNLEISFEDLVLAEIFIFYMLVFAEWILFLGYWVRDPALYSGTSARKSNLSLDSTRV